MTTDFNTYFSRLSRDEQEDFARRVQAARDYLYLISLGHKRAGWKLSVRIEEESGGEVTRYSLRSDIFDRRATRDLKPCA